MATLFVGVCLAGAFLVEGGFAGCFAGAFFAAGSAEVAALFSAALGRLGADFFGADVAMVDYPLPSSETEADWSQDSRSREGHVPARRADRGDTVVASSSLLDVPRVTATSRTFFSGIVSEKIALGQRLTIRDRTVRSRTLARHTARQ
jgi:hypothetical protein